MPASADPSAAAAALEALAAAALELLPEASSGRRRIVQAAGRAAAAWRALADLPARVGDDRADAQARAAGLAAARRAIEESRRAVEQARRTAREVRTMPDDALSRAWRVATAPARAVRDTIASALEGAANRAERVVTATTTTAAQAWGGAVSAIGVAGVIAALVAVWWFTRK